MIIGCSARARAGKDTVADYLVRHYDFNKIAFADALKRGCMAMFDLSEDQVYGDSKETPDEFWGCTPRYILQHVGTELMREGFDDQIWVKTVAKQIQENRDQNWVISDVRFPNEAALINHIGGYNIRIYRDGAGAGNHASETALDDYDDWDFVILNNGTLSELYDKVEAIMSLARAREDRLALLDD